MRRTRWILGTVVLLVGLFAGCSQIADALDDVIVGSWQQASVNGVTPAFVNVLKFTADNTYTASVGGVTTNTGTWVKNGSQYTLNGVLFGFASTTSNITPVFSDSNNTMTYTDGSGYAEVYKK